MITLFQAVGFHDHYRVEFNQSVKFKLVSIVEADHYSRVQGMVTLKLLEQKNVGKDK